MKSIRISTPGNQQAQGINLRRYFLIAVLCFAFTGVNAQDQKELQGKILADSIEAPIHVINLSRKKGKVSDHSGNFIIEASANDVLLFSSVQFQRKEVKVTAKMITDAMLVVKLEPDLTELEQVRLHNLTGNLKTDIANIEVKEMPVIRIPPPDFIPQKGTPNAAFNASQTMAPKGVDVLGLVGKLTGTPNFGSLQKIRDPRPSEREIVNKLRKRFDDYFFTSHLQLGSSHIINFLTYVFNSGIEENLLEEENALQLVVFLEKRSMEYLKSMEE